MGDSLRRFWIGVWALGVCAPGCGRTDSTVAVADDGSDTEVIDDDDDDGTTTFDFTSTTWDPTFTTSTSSHYTSSSTTNDTFGGVCGNGILEGMEECDPGDPLIGPGLECRTGCILNICGDGDPWAGEECDDGNNNNEDFCRNDCTLTNCGDGILDFGEECDDGDPDDNDECLTNCRNATCGDGFIWFGEEDCDDGDGNDPGADCTPDCTDNVCGDGYQHDTDEECDPGEDMIGDGMLCRDGCILNICGDGDQWAGEECDDGNGDNTDDCVQCNDAECGDGFVWSGMEDCDDNDANDLDRCHNDCSFHRVTQIALGGNHTCALFDSDNIKCWGNGNHGRTGHGSLENIGDDEPASAQGFVDVGDDVTQVVTGIAHTCVVHPDNTLALLWPHSRGRAGLRQPRGHRRRRATELGRYGGAGRDGGQHQHAQRRVPHLRADLDRRRDLLGRVPQRQARPPGTVGADRRYGAGVCRRPRFDRRHRGPVCDRSDAHLRHPRRRCGCGPLLG